MTRSPPNDLLLAKIAAALVVGLTLITILGFCAP